jgi:hypothetical protein
MTLMARFNVGDIVEHASTYRRGIVQGADEVEVQVRVLGTQGSAPVLRTWNIAQTRKVQRKPSKQDFTVGERVRRKDDPSETGLIKKLGDTVALVWQDSDGAELVWPYDLIEKFINEPIDFTPVPVSSGTITVSLPLTPAEFKRGDRTVGGSEIVTVIHMRDDDLQPWVAVVWKYEDGTKAGALYPSDETETTVVYRTEPLSAVGATVQVSASDKISVTAKEATA